MYDNNFIFILSILVAPTYFMENISLRVRTEQSETQDRTSFIEEKG